MASCLNVTKLLLRVVEVRWSKQGRVHSYDQLRVVAWLPYAEPLAALCAVRRRGSLIMQASFQQ